MSLPGEALTEAFFVFAVLELGAEIKSGPPR